MAEDAIDLQRLVVSLEASTTKYERALAKAQQTTSESMAAIDRLTRMPQTSISALSTSMERVTRRRTVQIDFPTTEVTKFRQQIEAISNSSAGEGLKSSLRGVAALFGVNEVRKYADAWQEASNRLVAAGVDVSRVASTQDQIAQIATRARVEFSSTADLYARLTRSSKDLGASQAEVAVVTETVAKALKMSGSSAAESSGAMTQLSQALQSGRLGGDELRSLLEGAPVLASAIAKEFGVAVGALKELGSAGELSATRVFKALVNAAPEVEQAFKKTRSTVADAFATLETAAMKYVGQSQSIGAATGVTTTAIRALSGNFGMVADGATALGLVIATRLVAGGLVPAATAFGTSAAAALSAGVAHVAFSRMVGTSIVPMAAAGMAARGLSAALALVGGPVGAALLGATAATIYFANESYKAQDRAKGYAEALTEVQAKAAAATPAVRGMGEAVTQAAAAMTESQRNMMNSNVTQALEDQRKAAFDLLTTLSRDPTMLRALGDGDVARGLEVVKAAMNGNADAALALREKLYALANSNPSFQGLADKASPLLEKLAGISAYIAKIRAQMGTLGDGDAAAKEKSIAARIPNPTAGTKYDEDTRMVNQDPVIQALKGAGMAQRAVADAEMNESKKKFRDARKKLKDEIFAQGGSIEPAALDAGARRIVAAESSGGGGRAKKSDEEKEADKRAAAIKNLVSSLEEEARVLEAEASAEGRSNAEKRTAVELTKLKIDASSAEGQQITAIIAKNEQLKASQEKTKAHAADVSKAGSFFSDSLATGLDDLIVKGRSAEDVFKNLLQTIMSAALKAAIFGTGPLGGLMGGGGGLVGAMAGMFHEGGTVGLPPPSQRIVPAAMFNSAPRYHTGLGAKEFPAILERGERVLTQKDAKRSDRTMGGLSAMLGSTDRAMRQSESERSDRVIGGLASLASGGGPGEKFKFVVENHGAKVSQQEPRRNGEGQTEIRMMIEGMFADDMQRNGPMSKMMAGMYGMQRTTGKR
jgi:tape measure domain-containing protein